MRDSWNASVLLIAAITCQHEIIALCIDAHGKVGWLAVFRLRFLWALSPCRDYFSSAGDHVGNLHGDSGPGAFSFTARMNGNQTARDLQLRDVWILLHDFSAEDSCVKGGSTL